MKRKAASGLLVLMSVLSLSTGTVPVFADTNQEVTEAGSKTTTITYDQASTFTVTIPKSIILGSDKIAGYKVSISGDIAGNETVTVVPDATVVLNDSNGKDPVTGTITQEKTEFSSAEISGGGTDGAVTNGNVAAVNLTAGDWSGAFDFTVGISEKRGEDITLTNKNLATYGIATTGDVIIPEYVIDSDGTKHKVTSIGNKTFQGCKSLTSITLQPNITTIGEYAFDGCSGLVSFTMTNNITNIGKQAFGSAFDYNANAVLNLPDDLETIPDSFAVQSKISKVKLPSNVKNIKSGAFYYASSLKTVEYKGIEYTTWTTLKSALDENNVTIEDTFAFSDTYIYSHK